MLVDSSLTMLQQVFSLILIRLDLLHLLLALVVRVQLVELEVMDLLVRVITLVVSVELVEPEVLVVQYMQVDLFEIISMQRIRSHRLTLLARH